MKHTCKERNWVCKSWQGVRWSIFNHVGVPACLELTDTKRPCAYVNACMYILYIDIDMHTWNQYLKRSWEKVSHNSSNKLGCNQQSSLQITSSKTNNGFPRKEKTIRSTYASTIIYISTQSMLVYTMPLWNYTYCISGGFGTWGHPKTMVKSVNFGWFGATQWLRKPAYIHIWPKTTKSEVAWPTHLNVASWDIPHKWKLRAKKIIEPNGGYRV